ncbi:MAG: hypothetical protein M1817_002703 [Caeruleum heppii]|nr:MAG: hypothetical protein M1817_002703 [Caeruleum heppii]
MASPYPLDPRPGLLLGPSPEKLNMLRQAMVEREDLRKKNKKTTWIGQILGKLPFSKGQRPACCSHCGFPNTTLPPTTYFEPLLVISEERLVTEEAYQRNSDRLRSLYRTSTCITKEISVESDHSERGRVTGADVDEPNQWTLVPNNVELVTRDFDIESDIVVDDHRDDERFHHIHFVDADRVDRMSVSSMVGSDDEEMANGSRRSSTATRKEVALMIKRKMSWIKEREKKRDDWAEASRYHRRVSESSW